MKSIIISAFRHNPTGYFMIRNNETQWRINIPYPSFDTHTNPDKLKQYARRLLSRKNGVLLVVDETGQIIEAERWEYGQRTPENPAEYRLD